MESYLLIHFQSKSCTNLSETKFWHKKKRAPKRKFLKNAILETETIEFGWKMMNLQGSPSRWPISNRKVALICLKLNSGAKNKTTTETKILKKNAISEAENDGIWPKNDEPLTESYLLTQFQSKRCTNLSETEFWDTKKTSTGTKIF